VSWGLFLCQGRFDSFSLAYLKGVEQEAMAELIQELQNHYSRAGKVIYIGVRPARLEPVNSVKYVQAIADFGLEGDRYRNKGSRQVTIIQAEHLQAVSSFRGNRFHQKW
jgi:hypothetical protein